MGKWSRHQCWHEHLWLAGWIQWAHPSCQACGTETGEFWPCRWAKNRSSGHLKTNRRESLSLAMQQRGAGTQTEAQKGGWSTAVISPVGYSNLSLLWHLGTAQCHQHHTPFGQWFWFCPLVATVKKGGRIRIDGATGTSHLAYLTSLANLKNLISHSRASARAELWLAVWLYSLNDSPVNLLSNSWNTLRSVTAERLIKVTTFPNSLI